MNNTSPQSTAPPRIERLKVQNFRALHDVELKDLTPLTVLLGPNGSGKSTVFDVFAFLAECFESGLRRAWDKRGRARELKSRGEEGPVLIELAYREQPDAPRITYHLEINEENGRPVVDREWLQWRRGSYSGYFKQGLAKVEAAIASMLATWSRSTMRRLRSSALCSNNPL